MRKWWDGARSRQLGSFYWSWFRGVFRGFRSSYETGAFWLTFSAIPFGKWIVPLVTDAGMTMERLAWQVPLAIVGLIGLWRFLTVPATLFISKPQQPSDTAPRPLVSISAEWTQKPNGHWVTAFSILNSGNDLAVDIAASFRVPYTEREVSFKLSRLAPAKEAVLMPSLREGGRILDDLYAPLDQFIDDAWREWVNGRHVDFAIRKAEGGEIAFKDEDDAKLARYGQLVGLRIGEPCEIPFDVTYRDFTRRVMFTTSHLFVYDVRRQARSHLDPPQISVSLIADRQPVIES